MSLSLRSKVRSETRVTVPDEYGRRAIIRTDHNIIVFLLHRIISHLRANLIYLDLPRRLAIS